MTTTFWEQHQLEDKVIAVLKQVRPVVTDHHFGQPFITAYQLAIQIDRSNKGLADALGVKVGGQGTGEHTSLSQYLAHQLSTQIRQHGPTYPVEGAFLSGQRVVELRFRGTDEDVVSSNTASGSDLSMFRLHEWANSD